MKKYLELIRIKHWIKNVLIFIPIICANVLTYKNIFKTILGFISFSLMASFIYIVNDIKDIDKDKLHPRKSKRPIPSGDIKRGTAIIVSVFIFVISLAISLLKLNTNYSVYILLSYAIMNILYSCGLKNIAIIDVVILATGFILRVFYGAAIINVSVSNWLFLTILNASLFLGLGKRRKEISNNKKTRKVLQEYNEEFLNKFQYLTLGLTIVFYSLWTMEQNISYFFMTIPLLMIIFMRYCLIIEKSDEGDPTTILYSDKTLIIISIFYTILMTFFLL